MLSVSGLATGFGGEYLFRDISFQLRQNDRVGLVGRNGAGKSTLLRIIAGEGSYEEGSVAKPNGYTIGYLPQEMVLETESSVWDESLNAFAPLLKLQADIDKLTHDISHAEDTSSDAFMNQLDALHEKQERFGMLGGYDMESQTEKVLLGLGFERDEFQRPVKSFSGGWRMRVALAKLLLARPDLLLMDEPTNHLDIDSVGWLEDFLKNYSGALMLVSHDRVFLDTITNRTFEIAQRTLFDYYTNYTGYLEQKAMRQEQQQAAYENQQQKIAEMERFVERFKAKASKATQAQSRVKMLEKMERIELEVEDKSAMNIRFPEPPRSGRMVVEAHHLRKSYGDNLVLKGLDFEIERGEKVAFLGKNGEGKSTLARIIAGELNYDKGELKYGHNVEVAYYAQHQTETLPMEKTILEAMEDVAPPEARTQLRSILGAFLFSGRTVEKKVRVLSGGEKSRVALARLLLRPTNLIILDEPTNHLDMASKSILKEALQAFPGTLIIVSHDRDFLEGLTNRVFALKNGALQTYPGNLKEYLDRQAMLEAAQNPPAAPKKEAPKPQPQEQKPAQPAAPKVDFAQQKQMQNRLRKLQRDLETKEANIARMEEEVKALEAKLSGVKDFKEQMQMLNDYNEKKAKLEKEMKDWEAMALEVEELEGVIGGS